VTRVLAADADGIRRAADVLRSGGLVAFPTETVYGLGARADDGDAVRRIYAAKGRPSTNPSIVHVHDVEAASRVGHLGPAARQLASALWPGPLTLVVERVPGAVDDAVTAGGASVGVRVPQHPVALGLLRELGLPVAAPSANRSTHVSPTRAEHVVRSLGDAVDLVLDGGASERGIESTIVDARRDDEASVLRLGALPAALIAATIAPRPLVDRSARVDAGRDVAPAPGGQARHYAPAGLLVVVPRGRIAEHAATLARSGGRVGIVAAGTSSAAPCACEVVLAPGPDAYAAGLYAALHDLEARGCSAIVVERVPGDDAWAAVRDRLRRASAPVPDAPEEPAPASGRSLD
jgi:L-threonylcarbamoyladenylate synthase